MPLHCEVLLTGAHSYQEQGRVRSQKEKHSCAAQPRLEPSKAKMKWRPETFLPLLQPLRQLCVCLSQLSGTCLYACLCIYVSLSVLCIYLCGIYVVSLVYTCSMCVSLLVCVCV